jgi:integrase
VNPIPRELYLDDRELAALLLAARSSAARNRVRDYTLLVILANTGVRPGEALALKLGDLWLGGHEPRIRVRRLKKRREQGVIDDLPISRGLARAVARYLEAAELDQAATPEARLFPIGVRNAEHIFKRHARAAGIRPEARLYCLRHTAGTRAYAAS